MTIKNNLNQKELIAELETIGITSKIALEKIAETVKNDFLWFRIGDVVATYSQRKRKKWCLMYR